MHRMSPSWCAAHGGHEQALAALQAQADAVHKDCQDLQRQLDSLQTSGSGAAPAPSATGEKSRAGSGEVAVKTEAGTVAS